MRVNKTTIYEKGYKPRIVYAKVEIAYYPEKLRDLAKIKPEKVRSKVKSFVSGPGSIVIDEQGLVPTMRLHESAIKRFWQGTDTLLESSFAWIKNITILHEQGRVNYEFNQNEH